MANCIRVSGLMRSMRSTAVLFGFLSLTVCAADDRITSAGHALTRSGALVTRWNARAFAAFAVPAFIPLFQARSAAIMHISMFDAVPGELLICPEFREFSLCCENAEMRDLVILFIHLLTTAACLWRIDMLSDSIRDRCPS